MGTRKGRRIAINALVTVIVLIGALASLGRDHIRFMLAFEFGWRELATICPARCDR